MIIPLNLSTRGQRYKNLSFRKENKNYTNEINFWREEDTQLQMYWWGHWKHSVFHFSNTWGHLGLGSAIIESGRRQVPPNLQNLKHTRTSLYEGSISWKAPQKCKAVLQQDKGSQITPITPAEHRDPFKSFHNTYFKDQKLRQRAETSEFMAREGKRVTFSF